ncbi:MAG TPA: alpha-L-rhamnosidase C-terminal domain-containing protein [Bacteroidales bacterium]|nr:alpha-L-rhamnosidase C-terminal domain-containing protein [Bacteroidales bacterium]HQH24453.1 alpha-L-rhamnosidase C-terminal domain-containing protein [Bacteroidales bacterium]HQJ81414.1 alpha-L-rhamnosidase C-terminal domain-containing protein [Bacteroidales bacterium]
MVEFIRDPEGVRIMDLRPEFTWIVPLHAKNQTACEILVSSGREKLEKDIADIWNSGKMIAPASCEVEYGGPLLSPDSRYFWKVRIWDEKDRPAGYSEIRSFTTGNPAGYATTANKFRSSSIHPLKLTRISEGHYFADFGKDAFGKLIITGISPDIADTLTVHLGEKLAAANTVDRNPGGTIRYYRVKIPLKPGQNSFTAELPPDERNTGPSAVHLPDSLGIIAPFRYAEIENCSFRLEKNNLVQEVTSYFFDDGAGSFTCSDTILNQVWDMCKYTMKATSFAGIYIDGDRERIPYEADAYINQLGHYYTDREYSMGRLTNEYFIKHPTWPTEWILHTVLMFWNDYMFTGNPESLREYYEELRHKTLISLAREDGLISSKNATDRIMEDIGFSDPGERIRDIVDWPPAQKDTGWKLAGPEGERDGYDMVEINTVVNSFYYRNLFLMSEIAGILGKTDDSAFFRRESEKVRKSINEKLLDRSKGIYLDGENSEHSSLHANMMPLAFGIIPAEYRKSVIEFIKSRGMACSVYGAQYLLEGLFREGEAEYAVSLMNATHDRSWWNMIRTGSTMAMEAWDMKYKPNSDWNHAWGAVPANIIPGYMWGIAPAEPGFAAVTIRPQLSGLTYSKIEVPTIRGKIVAEFRAKGKSSVYTVNIPANMKGRLILPDREAFELSPGINSLKQVHTVKTQ